MEPTSPYLEKHVLVCIGESCGPQGGAAVRAALKQELKSRGLRKLYRDGECTCLGLCRDGVNAVIWPEGTYLAGVTTADVPRLVERHSNELSIIKTRRLRAESSRSSPNSPHTRTPLLTL